LSFISPGAARACRWKRQASGPEDERRAETSPAGAMND
jgi:hypothetical protein